MFRNVNGDSSGKLGVAVEAKGTTGVSERTEGSEVALRLTGVTRRFGSHTAVNAIDLEVRRGEVFALLGASGCGKSTTLRMIAGLEPLDAGRIELSGRVLADADVGKVLPPERRGIAMVFQSYAVWPHMTVAQNVGFPLQMRRVRRAERRRRVKEILEVTGLGEMADRPATMLSGGQQQRVALARALVYTPDLLLLDEPLSNLDARLRIQMRREIRRLNRELGVSMLFVTHDQEEALSLADRIAVMNNGVVEQIGTPDELYDRPATPFARDFLGRRVVFHGNLVRDGERTVVKLSDPALGQSSIAVTEVPAEIDDGAAVGVYSRPEDLTLINHQEGEPIRTNCVLGQVISTAYLGESLEYEIRIGDATSSMTGSRRSPFRAGDDVLLEIDPQRATVWPA